MKTARKQHEVLFAAFCMLILILDSKAALLGAKEGLILCIESVIPSLFPMLFISVYLNSRLRNLNLGFLSPVTRQIGIPFGFEGILLIGCLGGYPVGAQTVSQAYKNKEIDKETAEHLLTFCNNAGPAFIFGVTSVLFHNRLFVWSLWVIHIVSAYISGLLLSNNNGIRNIKTENIPPQTVVQALRNAVRILSSICAWIIVFRVVIHILDRWLLWIFPDWLRIVITGVLELTNGCFQLPAIESDVNRFLLCSVLLGFGGLCVLMQTISVISPLNPMKYVAGKIVQTSLSFLLSSAVLFLTQPMHTMHIPLFSLLIPCVLIIIVVFLQKKTVAKSKKMLYTIPNRQN